MPRLNTRPVENELAHIGDHAVLRAAAIERGVSAASLPIYDADSTGATHRAIHVALHTEHNALNAGGTLPTTLDAKTTAHLNHHALLAAAHNARQPAESTYSATYTATY